MSSKDNIKRLFARKRFVFFFVLLVMLAVVFILQAIELPLEPELVATVRIDPAYDSDGLFHEMWYAVYGSYNGYPGTWIHYHEWDYQNVAIDSWPELDLENYTYIFTYNYEIESLHYKPFCEINSPFRTYAKEGLMVLKEEAIPYKIFIYRIPRMRINNPV